MRLSWGALFSAMSMFDMILKREVSGASTFFGSFIPSIITPSTRYRTHTPSLRGSM